MLKGLLNRSKLPLLLEFPYGTNGLYAFHRHDARVQRCADLAGKPVRKTTYELKLMNANLNVN